MFCRNRRLIWSASKYFLFENARNRLLALTCLDEDAADLINKAVGTAIHVVTTLINNGAVAPLALKLFPTAAR